MKDIEIEIKVKIHDLEPLKIRLETNANYMGESRQIDIYLDPPNKTFITTLPDGKKAACEYFRIRKSSKGNSICYKYVPKNLETGEVKRQFTEIETKLEDAESMLKIFNILGFTQTAIIDKIRNTYTYRDFILEVDTVKDLGIFLEIEYSGLSEDKDEIEKSLFDFINSIDIGKFDLDNEGYVQLRWMKQNYL